MPQGLRRRSFRLQKRSFVLLWDVFRVEQLTVWGPNLGSIPTL